MTSSNEVVSFMDILDLDEDIIDARLKSIMVKKHLSNKQLASAVHLLQYKLLINTQEGTECDTEEECNFVAKLIHEVHEGNIDVVCKIISTVLQLNNSTIVSKSEHLLQQILGNIGIATIKSKGMSGDSIEEETPSKSILNLKLCDSILDAVLKTGQILELNFLDIPIESILSSADAKLKGYFLIHTAPHLFKGITGYNILDKIWNYFKGMSVEDNIESILKSLSCLSEFYLPVTDSKGVVKFESNLIFQYEFWNIILHGLQSNDPTVRKLSLYLAKRAMDCLITLRRDICIQSETCIIFTWQQNCQNKLKTAWDNFFILIDSLEEKQSNIVLPSLQLFNELGGVEQCWINCAFQIGLKHENAQVRLKCVNYKLMNKLTSENEAMLLLEALNDINLYDDSKNCTQLNDEISTLLEDVNTFLFILKTIPRVKWSPVPLFYITKVLSSTKQKKIVLVTEPSQLTQAVIEILKVPCNNIAVRKAVKLNVAYFLTNSCRNMGWKELLKLYSAIDWNSLTFEKCFYNPFTSMIQQVYLNDNEKQEFFEIITSSYHNIDFGLAYLDKHDNDMTLLLNVVYQRIKKIQDIINRQYSDKAECLKEFIFLTYLYDKTSKRDTAPKEFINEIISRDHKIFIRYISCILSSNLNLTIEEKTLVFQGFSSIAAKSKTDTKENILQLYKSALLMINDTNSDLHSRVTAVFVLNDLKSNITLTSSCKNEMLDIKQTTKIIYGIKFKDTQNMDNDGRLRNVIYEKLCEILLNLLPEQEKINCHLKEVIECIDKFIECGGYGCLKWILKIVNIILPSILNEEGIKFDVIEFVNRMWKETDELKSNNQYSPCIVEFINLITQEALLKKAIFNNVFILYGSKIIDYGPLKNTPLFYLANKLNSIEITKDMSHLLYVLSQMLLYSPVPRKDQRIADNVVVQILKDPNYGFDKHGINFHFTFEIQLLSVSTLCKIRNLETLDTVISFLVKNVEEIFNSKQRYHGNSQIHRTLLHTLQHLLVIVLLNPKIVDSKYLTWSLDFLGKLPHQPSVRICLEWFIALHFYIKVVNLNEVVETLNDKNIPLTSQLMILYWTLKHKIANGNYKIVEYVSVMDALLSHTMGQLFNIRLISQFLATKLFAVGTQNHDKYAYTIEVINKTFVESSKDKNFVKLKQDFFVNDFDIVSHLTPCFIYYFLPRYCDITNNEIVDERLVNNILKYMDESISSNSTESSFKQEWISVCKKDDEVFNYKLHIQTENKEMWQNDEAVGTIQKKYIPWKNMNEIEVYDGCKKKDSSSELIVVASLIDKLPNLGGMARTSEIFGVNTYVINSLRHLQDKMFQGLSVSAERWVNIEEVRPGAPLKEYLTRKKAEGYSVVAAEQTSTSIKLQSFKFPKKTLLLLGHEKEGIPCDLLPMMDHCVEIPQQGFLRSLNVHVTAAIFVWEYTRQNLL